MNIGQLLRSIRLRMVTSGSVLAAQAAATTMVASCDAEAAPYLAGLAAGLTAVGGVAGNLLASATEESIRPAADRTWNHDLLRAGALAVRDIVQDELDRQPEPDPQRQRVFEQLAAAITIFYDRGQTDQPPVVLTEQELLDGVRVGDAFRLQPAGEPQIWTAFLQHVAREAADIEEFRLPQDRLEQLGAAISRRFHAQLFEVLKFDFDAANSPLQGRAFAAITLRLLQETAAAVLAGQAAADQRHALLVEMIARLQPQQPALAKLQQRIEDSEFAGQVLREFGEQRRLLEATHDAAQTAATEATAANRGIRELAEAMRQRVAARPMLAPLTLQAPVADFTGRESQLEQLRRALGQGAVLLTAVRGMGGVGKTEVARRLAWELKDQYDLVLEINLHGASRQNSLTSQQAIERLIRAVRPEAGQLPDDLDQLRSIWLGLLAERRALLLLDNARDAAQVRPLLPDGDGHVTLITSRIRFTLPNLLETIDLGAMTLDESVRLLGEKICPRLSDDESQQVADECGYLPLALRLAGSYLRDRDNLPVAHYLSDLRRHRLELLDAAADEAGEASVTATLELSYQGLSERLQAQWRQLAVFPGSFDTPAAGAVWELAGQEQESDVIASLAELVRLSMLEWDAANSRYSLHDLARDFAVARLASDMNEQAAASFRHAGHFERVLAAADDHFLKGHDGVLIGLGQFDQERVNIEAGHAAAARRAGESDALDRLLAAYANAGAYVLNLRLHAQDLIRWLELQRDACGRLGDRRGRGDALCNMGLAYKNLGLAEKAIGFLEQALQIGEEISDPRIVQPVSEALEELRGGEATSPQE